MSTVNLYDVLNVSQEAQIKDIKDAYRKLVKEFHPDKLNGDESMFELITHAYNILINPVSRMEYDEIYTLSKTLDNSHFDLKMKSEDFFKSMETDVTKKKLLNKEDQKEELDKIFEEMDRKHGYNRNKEFSNPLDEEDINRRLRDLELARENDDIESMHEQIFDTDLDIEKFNAAFDMMHKTQHEMIPHQGNPEAWDFSKSNNVSVLSSGFTSIDNYDNLYAEDNDIGNSVYGSIKTDNKKNNKLKKSDINNLNSPQYTKRHNYKEENYDKLLEQKMKERDLETKKYESRTFDDFNTDPSCGGYSIFDKLGIKSTNNMYWDDQEDIKTRYKRLLEIRDKDKTPN